MANIGRIAQVAEQNIQQFITSLLSFEPREACELYQFRKEAYQTLEQRADTGLNLIDALTSAPLAEPKIMFNYARARRTDWGSASSTWQASS
jgi:hypothetical protein